LSVLLGLPLFLGGCPLLVLLLDARTPFSVLEPARGQVVLAEFVLVLDRAFWFVIKAPPLPV
jgi:hypothetical protein